jgi:multidrug efflux pump subunit AcrA (membrane-fusion protein)
MDIHNLELKIALPEPELHRVAEGARVSARFASMDRTVESKIARIIRSVDPLTRSFEVISEIPNDDLSLKPGIFADVKISTSKPRRRLLVPTQAIVDEGSGVFAVFVAQADIARRIEVKVIVASQTESEVISGLTGGEEVIIDASGLIDGDSIQHQGQRAGGRLSAEASR